jgi:hypothetical protein
MGFRLVIEPIIARHHSEKTEQPCPERHDLHAHSEATVRVYRGFLAGNGCGPW